jgi:hypothetical protein
VSRWSRSFAEEAVRKGRLPRTSASVQTRGAAWNLAAVRKSGEKVVESVPAGKMGSRITA